MRRIAQFHHPRSLEDAVQTLEAAAGRAAIIAGGTEIVANLPQPISALIDITRLGLDRIETSATDIHIGACVTLQQLADSIPLRNHLDGTVREAAIQSASRFIRNAATVGGNLASCNPAWDLLPALMVADARVHLHGTDGEKTVPIDAFIAARASHLASSRIITGVTLSQPPSNTRARFEKLARCVHDAPIVTAVVRLDIDAGRLSGLRAAVSGATANPTRVSVLEQALEGASATPDAIAEACRDLARHIAGVADVRATAAYRAEMAEVLLRRALLGAIG